MLNSVYSVQHSLKKEIPICREVRVMKWRFQRSFRIIIEFGIQPLSFWKSFKIESVTVLTEPLWTTIRRSVNFVGPEKPILCFDWREFNMKVKWLETGANIEINSVTGSQISMHVGVKLKGEMNIWEKRWSRGIELYTPSSPWVPTGPTRIWTLNGVRDPCITRNSRPQELHQKISNRLEWASSRHLLNRRTIRSEYLAFWLPLDYEINRASGTIRFQYGLRPDRPHLRYCEADRVSSRRSSSIPRRQFTPATLQLFNYFQFFSKFQLSFFSNSFCNQTHFEVSDSRALTCVGKLVLLDFAVS
jgi:hypothetical protein